jgi:hypothetical protein
MEKPMQLRALTYFALVLAAAGPGAETFQTGDWKGRANFNSEGAFTDCTILLADPESTTIGFVMTHGGDLGMIVANSALNMKPGAKKPVIIHMDGLDSFAAMSDVVAKTGVLVPLEIDGALVRNIEQDKEFRVTMREKEFNLQLSDTREALKTLKTCVETHRGKKRIEL